MQWVALGIEAALAMGMSEWIMVNLVWSQVPYSDEEVKEGKDFLAWILAERARLFGPDDDLDLTVDEVSAFNARVPELAQRARFHDSGWLAAILAAHRRSERPRCAVGAAWQEEGRAERGAEGWRTNSPAR